MSYVWHYDTPIGRLAIAETEGAVSHLRFDGAAPLPGYEAKETPAIRQAGEQLLAYFSGTRSTFDFPLHLQGTPFQKAAWTALQAIPFGETRSYKDIAVQLGNPKAVRAVGMANNRNLIPIFIPCHRVIGTNGSLTGYAGGLEAKQLLLDLEQQDG